MKKLIFNDKVVVLNPDTYFPFSQKVGTLDDITISGVPVTKSIIIPRCMENDDIMGHLCNIAKNNFNLADNKISVSINQIKRIPYTLYDDSVIISEGIVRVLSVDENGYEIELYDKLIDILETLTGDDESSTGWLSTLSFVISGGLSLSLPASAYNIQQLINNYNELRPCINLSEWGYSGNKARISIVGGSPNVATMNLPVDMTPAQFRTLKPYDFEYACPVSTVIRSINDTYDILTVDSSLNSTFNLLHYNLGKPKPVRIDNTTPFNNMTFSQVTGTTYDRNYSIQESKVTFNNTSSNIARDNGKRTLKFNLNGVLETNAAGGGDYFGGGKRNGIDYNNSMSDEEDGTNIGSIWVGFSLSGNAGALNATKLIESQVSYVQIDLVLGINCTFTTDGTFGPFGNERIKSVSFNQEVELDLDWYWSIYESPSPLTNYLNIYYDKLSYLNADNYTYFFQYFDTNDLLVKEIGFKWTPYLTSATVRRQYNEFRTGDSLNGQTLFPKVSIKEWLLALAKYLNLKLELVNGKIHISPKTYVQSTEILLIDGTPIIELNNIDFSKLILSSGYGKDDDVEAYEQTEQLEYGAKVINTGYTIKKQRKDIKFDLNIPVLKTDYNGYAYGAFGDYFNSGYNRVNYGLTKDTNNFTFGYINSYQTPIWIAPDTPYEANMKAGVYVPTGKEWTHVNRKIKYNGSTGKFIYPTDDSATNERMASAQHTLSPYYIYNGNVNLSMEMNKPRYSIAGILDANYSVSSTIYERIWKKIITDMYDSNTHILRARVYIDGKFNVYAIYNIQNTTYIPLEVEEYDPSVPGVYQVKFLRVNNITNYI